MAFQPTMVLYGEQGWCRLKCTSSAGYRIPRKAFVPTVFHCQIVPISLCILSYLSNLPVEGRAPTLAFQHKVFHNLANTGVSTFFSPLHPLLQSLQVSKYARSHTEYTLSTQPVLILTIWCHSNSTAFVKHVLIFQLLWSWLINQSLHLFNYFNCSSLNSLQCNFLTGRFPKISQAWPT